MNTASAPSASSRPRSTPILSLPVIDGGRSHGPSVEYGQEYGKPACEAHPAKVSLRSPSSRPRDVALESNAVLFDHSLRGLATVTEPERTEASASPSLGERLGSDYRRWTLDCIVTIAHCVAEDFSDRLEVYRHIADGTATQLTDLQANYGFQADFPDEKIRRKLMRPIFGESDGHGNTDDKSAFKACRLPVLAAAADFAENAQPTGFPGLRQRVRDALIPFKNHLIGLATGGGASLSQTERRMTFIFNLSQSILKDRDVSGVFTINDTIDPRWPLDSTDPLGAILIEQITTKLPCLPYGVIPRDAFVRWQRIAQEGSRSIQTTVDENTDDPDFDIDTLISDLYAWGSDLGFVGGNRPQHPAFVRSPVVAE